MENETIFIVAVYIVCVYPQCKNENIKELHMPLKCIFLDSIVEPTSLSLRFIVMTSRLL